MYFSSSSAVNTEYTVGTLTDRSALNYYYIVGLVVMAALLVVCVSAIATLLCYKTMGGDEFYHMHRDRPDAGMHMHRDRPDAVMQKSPGPVMRSPPTNHGPGHTQ